MSLSTDLQALTARAEILERSLDRIATNAFVLCRTLGYAHGEGGAAFVGPPTVSGFVDTETAVRQLIAALADRR